MSKTVRRLYQQLIPDSYHIHIQPDYDSWTFAGSLKLLGKVPKSTKTIVLHGSKLDIASALVNNQPAEVKVLADSQEIELNLDKTIAADTEVEVAIKYSSEIRDNMYGLYRSKFKDEEGEEQTILTTQFEANHARDMLPCVDEPEAKAVFHLSITAPEGLSTVSNTEVVSVDSKDGESTTNFAPTPKMSTYLLAIVVGELAYLEGKTKDGVRVRVYATSSNVEHTKFALECATATLEFFNRYFDIPYPLEKCDLLALPDFAAGAMENWGCITFREQALLVDEENTSFAVKQYVADVVAHELAHQWFGNLVTMQWWNDLWLNEGFATWVARLAVDEMFPEWKIWEDFVVEDVLRALSLDGLSNSHPIEVEVKDPDEIDEIFDAISYSKGAAVIHMLHSYLGADDFRHGLQNYLKANSLSNTTTNDLWQSLEETSQKPVAKFMSSWTKQTGYPLISYEKTDSGLKVNQARFLLLKQSDIQPQTWHVPISLANYPDKQFLLDKTSANFDIKIDGAPKFNPGQNSFYRTLYQPDDLQQISSSLADMEALDCINIIDDAFELSEAGRQKLVDVIPLTTVAKDSQSHIIWDVVLGRLGQLRAVFGEDVLARIFGDRLTRTQLDRLGWDQREDDSIFDTLMRPSVIALSSLCNVDSTIKETFRRFDNQKLDNPNTRKTIYSTVARNGDEQHYNRFLSMYKESDSAEEKVRLITALCSFKQTSLIENSLKLVNSDTVRKQEVIYWISYCGANPYGSEATWKWVKDNWDWLDENFRGSHDLARFPGAASSRFMDKSKAKELREFFKDKVPKRSLEQAVENIAIRSRWQQENEQQVKNMTPLL